jgi:DNA-binding transcriptional MerR regulator
MFQAMSMVTTEQELIELREVAEILGMSVPSLRDYKKHGLIAVAAKQGNKDLYDRADVVKRYAIITEKRRAGFSLAQISSMLRKQTVNVINVAGPVEPQTGMSSEELLHGLLAELYRAANPQVKAQMDGLSKKWNVHYEAETTSASDSNTRKTSRNIHTK